MMVMFPAGWYQVGSVREAMLALMNRMGDVETVLGQEEAVSGVIKDWRMGLGEMRQELEEAQQNIAEVLEHAK